MAKYELLEPTVDVLKVTDATTVHTLEDGSTKSFPAITPVGGLYYIPQADTFISATDLAAKYRPLA